MGQKRSAPSTPLEKTPKRGKGGSSPSYAQVATSQPPNKEGDWHVVTKKRKEKKKKRKEKKEKRAEDPAQKAQGTTATPKSKLSTPARSSDAIKVSAKDGQSYADILKEMKAKVDPRKAGLEVLSIQRPGRKKSFWSSKRGETFRPSERSSTWRSRKGRKFQPWSRRGLSKLGTSTRPLKEKRLCLPCA